MRSSKWLHFLFCLTCIFSCSDKKISKQKEITILIQPFSDMKSENVEFVANKIKEVYPNVKILESIDLPKSAYYKERNRYRADSLLRFLNQKTQNGFVTIGLTSKDISATKGKIKDFGMMGLGYRPGKSCIASNFRLNKSNTDEQFFKIAIHELGHTQGLKNCPEKKCFMRNAGGKNPTDEEIDFCEKCKTFLMNKNWKFSSI